MTPKIIKGGAAGAEDRAGGRVVRRAVYESGVAAEDIIEQARAAAEELVREAEAKKAEITQQAREEGRRQGLADWNDAIQAAMRARDSYLAECQEEVLRLAVRIAEKIIGESLKLDPLVQVSIVREALRSVRQTHHATIRVHPDAVGIVEQRLEQLRRDMPEGCLFTVKGDEQVREGGCIIQTDTSTVNASLEDQLRYFEERFQRESRR
jgi:type III secretion system HrpE/YscL family protein